MKPWKPFGSSAGLGPSDLGFAGRGQPLSLLDGCVGGGSEGSPTPSLSGRGRGFPQSDEGNILFPSCFSITSSEPSVIRDSHVPGQQVSDRKKCLLFPCQNVMPIPLDIRPEWPEFGHLFAPGEAIGVHCARRWQQSPCSLWIQLQQAEGNLAVSSHPCSWGALRGAGQSRSAHRRERWRPCCRDDHQWSQKSLGLEMSLGVPVTTAHCKPTFEQKIGCNYEIQ